MGLIIGKYNCKHCEEECYSVCSEELRVSFFHHLSTEQVYRAKSLIEDLPIDWKTMGRKFTLSSERNVLLMDRLAMQLAAEFNISLELLTTTNHENVQKIIENAKKRPVYEDSNEQVKEKANG